MPAKPKPAAVAPRVWNRHPWWTSVASVGAVVGIVAALWPILSPILPRYQTVDQAHKELADVRRQVAWLAVGQARQASTTARNRLNDCAIAKTKREPSSLEMAACEQYAQDMDAANKAYDAAVTAAKAASQ